MSVQDNEVKGNIHTLRLHDSNHSNYLYPFTSIISRHSRCFSMNNDSIYDTIESETCFEKA